jgi:hypothetical protein
MAWTGTSLPFYPSCMFLTFWLHFPGFKGIFTSQNIFKDLLWTVYPSLIDRNWLSTNFVWITWHWSPPHLCTLFKDGAHPVWLVWTLEINIRLWSPFYSEDGDSRLLWNVSMYTKLHGVTSRKTTILNTDCCENLKYQTQDIKLNRSGELLNVQQQELSHGGH